jgi:hypothetical protein
LTVTNRPEEGDKKSAGYQNTGGNEDDNDAHEQGDFGVKVVSHIPVPDDDGQKWI